MEDRKGKIGINTMLIVFIIATFSPSVRLFGTYATLKAQQAGWLVPVFASIVIAYLMLKLNTLLVNHPGLSLIKIYEKITGKLLAKFIAFIYLIWTINLLGINSKSYTMRLSTVLYPNIQENVFLIITLVIIGTLIIQSGLVVASRMFKIFFWITFIGFFILTSLLFPNVTMDKLTPISYLDIIPVLKGSTILISTWTYVTIFLIMSDNVIGMKDFKKRSLQTILFLFITITILLVSMIGSTGSYILSRASFPYLLSVEQIVLLESITGIEAILVVLWIMSDLALLTMLTFSCLKLIKYIFNIEDANIYTHILMVLTFFVTNLMAHNYYQLRDYAYKYVYTTNIILFTGIPILMAWIYKIRNKAKKALKKTENT